MPEQRLSGINLTAGYADRPVLKDVDFTVETGRVTALLGPNGSGKSTLLKTLARTLTPERGQVILDGQDIHHHATRDVARKLGILPQSPTAPDGMTVRELVSLGRFPYQRRFRQWSAEDERAVQDAMQTADVSDFAHRPIDALSGGQRQRCWIAMVLAQETELILLDEPTTFLDLKVQVDVLELLVRLAHDKGRTLLVVLHDLNLAAAYADRLVMLRNGEIVHSGQPEDVFTRQNLKQVFDLDAHVIRDPYSQRLVCVPSVSHGSASPSRLPDNPLTATAPL